MMNERVDIINERMNVIDEQMNVIDERMNVIDERSRSTEAGAERRNVDVETAVGRTCRACPWIARRPASHVKEPTRSCSLGRRKRLNFRRLFGPGRLITLLGCIDLACTVGADDAGHAFDASMPVIPPAREAPDDRPPAIAAAVPACAHGAGGTTVTLIGSGFRSGARVSVDTTDASGVHVPSSTRLDFALPARGGPPGPATLEIVNSDGRATRSSQLFSLAKPSQQFALFRPTAVATGGPEAGATVVADFDGDHRLDIAVINGYPDVGVLLGQGGGRFAPPVTYAGAVGGNSLDVADMNADGRPDLVIGSGTGVLFHGGGTSVLLGRGDGTFFPAIVNAGVTGSIAIGDFDGDGKPDLAATAFDKQSCDGYLDLVTGTSDAQRLSHVSVLLGNGDGSFRANTTTDLFFGDVSVLTAVDLNLDGHPDLVVAGLFQEGSGPV